MTVAEFEERSYEAPLYNQLERGNGDIFTPGQFLENRVGFDRGLFMAESALWETLGYSAPLTGAALAYYRWPYEWGPPHPRRNLPRYRLNLFLQAKRPTYLTRKPRPLTKHDGIDAPMWMFRIKEHQQLLLETLADKTRGRAHVAYACAAFHTSAALFTHTTRRTIVENSTFPSVNGLRGHDAWYFERAGAEGTANPNPENIHEQPLLERTRAIERDGVADEGGDLAWLDSLATSVVAAVRDSGRPVDALTAQFFDDLQTLERLSETYELRPTIAAYTQVRLFTIRFDVSWLVCTDAA